MAIPETNIVLLVIATIILLGFIGNLIFRKTNIPNTIWLLLFGLFLGQVFPKVLDKGLLASSAGLFGAIAVIIILSEGGMSFELSGIVRHAARGFVLMFAGIFLSIATITTIAFSGGIEPLRGLLLGLILAGTSAAVVVPVVTRLRNLSKSAKSLLVLESIADNFSVVVVFLLMDFLALQAIQVPNIPVIVAHSLIIGVTLGASSGFVWAYLIDRFKHVEYSYAATLAMLFLLYVVTEFIGGSGAIACFTGGMALANSPRLLNSLQLTRKKIFLDLDTARFHSLVAFFIRTFFFVYLGMIVSFSNLNGFLLGLAVVAGLFLVRPLSVWLVTKKASDLSIFDRKVMTVLFPRGLTPAVLASLPAAKGIAGTGMFPDIVFSVILGSVVFSTVAIYLIERGNRRGDRETGKDPRQPSHAAEFEAFGEAGIGQVKP